MNANANTGHPFYTPLPSQDTEIPATTFPALQVICETLDAVIEEMTRNQALTVEIVGYFDIGLQELTQVRDAYRPVIDG